jgi:uncharacterized protein (TIGR02001 family)
MEFIQMKKMIFMVSALMLGNTLLSQSVFAETFQSTSNTATTLPTNTEPGRVDADPAYDANADMSADTNKAQLHRSHTKKRSHATVTANAPMKDKAPDCKPYDWLDNLSGNMTMASNYVFRGVSQTRNLPAVQGSLTYQFPIGLYLNAWGSNVKFIDTDATLELDSLVGWRGDIWEDFSYDLNVDRYNYPGAAELSYLEFNSVFNYKIFQVGYSYSDNVYATHAPGRYYLFGINYDIPSQYTLSIEDVSIHATAGHYTLPKVAGDSYNDYSAWVCKRFHKTYLATLQWTGTNGRQHAAPIDSNHLFVLLTAEF